MHLIDWIVLFLTLVSIVLYGVWKGGRSKDMRAYLLANREIPWYMVGLSVMATQASAITFLSTTGQGYSDGMRFVQFYFGLPLAMIVLCIAFIPRFHTLGVYTAYEYLERRFDLKTRTFAAFLFLLQRGLSTGFTLYAPALVLSLLIGWNTTATTTFIGLAVIVYTVTGGAKAVGYTQMQQMAVIWIGMFAALGVTLSLLPETVSFTSALDVAGAAGRMQAITTPPNWWEDRYTLYSGIIGGFFLQLSYFGTDQSQVQRYLTAPSVKESRMGLILNGFIKVPMQVVILFVGVMVFAFYQFNQPELYFHAEKRAEVLASPYAADFQALEQQHQTLFQRKKAQAEALAAAEAQAIPDVTPLQSQYQQTLAEEKALRKQAMAVVEKATGAPAPADNDFVFLTFVVQNLPRGLVGLVIAVIFAASMSSCSAALNSLTSSTIVDVYRRMVRPDASEAHYVKAGRISTLLWGIFCILTAGFAARLGNLIETVNILGSLFYGTILGIFLTAFFLKTIRGNAVFMGALVAQAAVLGCFFGTGMSYLWYNLIGTALVPLSAVLFQLTLFRNEPPPSAQQLAGTVEAES